MDWIAAAWLAQSMPPEGPARKNPHGPSEGAQDNLPHAYRKITLEPSRLRCPATHRRALACFWGVGKAARGSPQVWHRLNRGSGAAGAARRPAVYFSANHARDLTRTPSTLALTHSRGGAARGAQSRDPSARAVRPENRLHHHQGISHRGRADPRARPGRRRRGPGSCPDGDHQRQRNLHRRPAGPRDPGHRAPASHGPDPSSGRRAGPARSPLRARRPQAGSHRRPFLQGRHPGAPGRAPAAACRWCSRCTGGRSHPVCPRWRPRSTGGWSDWWDRWRAVSSRYPSTTGGSASRPGSRPRTGWSPCTTACRTSPRAEGRSRRIARPAGHGGALRRTEGPPYPAPRAGLAPEARVGAGPHR